MTEIIAGIEIPDTITADVATRHVAEISSPLLFHHSRRVFLFAALHARRLGLAPDPELLYVASMFHDTGLHTPFSDKVQRFEVDGADHARSFLLKRGFPQEAANLVWSAIALHTTPELPGRMDPEIALTNLGVLTDAIGVGFDDIDPDAIDEITAAHPRGDFKNEFMQAFHEGLKHRPETAYGTINADVLEHFVPGYRRDSMVERVMNSPWAA
ncbi:HD domain-containing protein [Gryllotalpicola daejeonensis]|uniref:HD domain-containing protein n=1 Tax=Gryllotalpicola daejeonensis TaxID=993087 RepID=A0ABP7ZK17_9MICO